MADRSRVRRIADRALDVAEGRRERFLSSACRGAPELEAEVRQAMRWMESSTESPFLAPLDPAELARGTEDRIGPYRLVRLLGSGAMGSVYEAERDDPPGTVALKLLHADVDSEASLASFRVESEVLSRFHHPGIGQLHAVGTIRDAAGRRRAYLVMEFVERARSLLQYVRERSLATPDVLRLFQRIAEAVQYGHDKGVIHRDLKPGNVLVDGSGHPKVIDYGVARMVDSDLTLTGGARGGRGVVGTLAYMSPEQAGGHPDDVDVRTDVWALGVCLYEALCDRPPYLVAGLPPSEALGAVLRQEPPAPRSLVPDLPRELDWILRRALARRPQDRYESARAFRDDLDRHLRGLPVEAAPPSRVYRLAKLARRHLAAVVAASVCTVALVTALVVVSASWVRESDLREVAERESAQSRLVGGFLMDLFRGVGPESFGSDVRVRDVLDWAVDGLDREDAEGQEFGYLLRGSLAQAYFHLGLLEKATELYEESLSAALSACGEDHIDVATARINLANCLVQTGRIPEARRLAELAIATIEHEKGEEALDTLEALSVLAGIEGHSGDPEAAAEIAARVLEGRRRLLGETAPATLAALNNLQTYLRWLGRTSEALPALESAVAACREQVGDRHPVTLELRSSLAGCLADLGELERARDIYRDVIATRARDGGGQRAATMRDEASLAVVMGELGDLDLAISTLHDLLRRFSDEDPLGHVRSTMVSLANLYAQAERFEESIWTLEELIETTEVRSPGAARHLALYRRELGAALLRVDALDRAERELRRAHEGFARLDGVRGRETLATARAIVELLERQGRSGEAAPYRSGLDSAPAE